MIAPCYPESVANEGSDAFSLSILNKQTPHKIDAMQSITNLFVVKEALSLQGQAFQRLACWVFQHNPQPEVPFQVDNDNAKN